MASTVNLFAEPLQMKIAETVMERASAMTQKVQEDYRGHPHAVSRCDSLGIRMSAYPTQIFSPLGLAQVKPLQRFYNDDRLGSDPVTDESPGEATLCYRRRAENCQSIMQN